MRYTNRVTFLAVLSIFLFSSNAFGETRLPSIFGNEMVLQCDKPISIWGWDSPGKKVVVTFGEQSETATTTAQGRWELALKAEKPSFENRELKVSGSNELTLSNVLVGEVWHCGGQSNMEWTLRATRDADIEVDSANFPAIRYIRLPKVASPTPQDDFPVANENSSEGRWIQCTSPEVENCTGVGYYFAKRLHRRLNIPVGLIDTSWGGTMAQHWCSKESLNAIPAAKPYIDEFDAAMKTFNDGGGEAGAQRRLQKDIEDWEVARDKAKAAGEREPRRPNANSYTNPSTKRQPAGMFNGMLVPIANYTVRGALFYQGENNSFGSSWKPFPKTFPAVVKDWRTAIGDDEMPFGIIQISGWSNRRTMTYDMNHHCNVTREIQFNTWRSTTNTGLIVTYDTNSNGSIHPGRKLPVGERSARWALAEVYKIQSRGSNKPLQWIGPVYSSNEVKDGKVYIDFEEGTNGGLRLDQDVDVGFYIAGENKEFRHASARIQGNQLVVWHDDVPQPKAVRYAFSNLPAGGLMNSRELPAYPFRTDDWPMTPHQSTGSYNADGTITESP
ncbi:MAG: sialate O-acetylesterase [Pirellulaceae bacterium]|jgi:sialate O-acetylesterase